MHTIEKPPIEVLVMDNSRVRLSMTAGILLVYVLLLGLQTAFAQNTTPTIISSSGETHVGKLLYSDDFSSSKSGWPIYSEGDTITTYKKGVYHFTIIPENYWDGVLAPRLNLSDFVVEVEATKESGPDDNAYGVWIRNQNPGSFYAFFISSDGYYEFAKKENGNWTTPSNWTRSSAIKTGNEVNSVKVAANGNKLSFYANGEKLGDYTDSSFAYGGLGLWVGSQTEGNVTIGFDNFKVWAIE